MMALSGVRSSWLMLETNCDLFSLAICELSVLVLDLVEQPHVLDRDHRLVGEGGDQLDLLVGERPDLSRAHHASTPIGRPSRSIGTPSRCVPRDSLAPQMPRCIRVASTSDVDTGALRARRPQQSIRAACLDRVRAIMRSCRRSRRKAIARSRARRIAILGRDCLVGVAKSCGRFDQRLQHGLQIEGRAADDLEHVGGGGLLLLRFARSSLSSRVFSMAMTAWSAKFVTSSICLSERGTSWR